VEECPQCKGRRLRSTHEERDHAVDGVAYTGFARVTFCKTCGGIFRDKSEDAAFVRDVALVASKNAREGEAPRKIRRRR
jgi:hypothetical protein